MTDHAPAVRYRMAVAFMRRTIERDSRSDRFRNLFLSWDDVIDAWEKQKADALFHSWQSCDLPPAQKTAWVITRAYSDPLEFRAAQLFIAKLVGRGEEMPPFLRAWAAYLLKGEAKPPEKRGKPYISNDLLSIVLMLYVKDVMVKFDLKATKNASPSVKSGGAYCACDAVAEGWNEFRKHLPRSEQRAFPTMSFSTVSKAYFRYKTPE